MTALAPSLAVLDITVTRLALDTSAKWLELMVPSTLRQLNLSIWDMEGVITLPSHPSLAKMKETIGHRGWSDMYTMNVRSGRIL